MNGAPSFEDRLLAVLETQIMRGSPGPAAEPAVRVRTRPRTTRVVAAAGAAALIVAAMIGAPVLFGQDGGSAAWAVQTRDDGSVEVRIRKPQDAAGLERRLAAVGVPAYVNFVPVGMVCAQRTIRSDISLSALGIESDSQGIVVEPGRLATGERLVLSTYVAENGDTVATHVNLVPIGEERCTIIPMYSRDGQPDATPTPGR